MREQQPAGAGCPGKDRGIIRSPQPHVLNPDDVDLGVTTAKAYDDLPVEVLIREECEHRSLILPPCQQSLAHSFCWETSLILCPDLSGKIAALG